MKTVIKRTVKGVHKEIINGLVSENSAVFCPSPLKGLPMNKRAIEEARGTYSSTITVELPRSFHIISP